MRSFALLLLFINIVFLLWQSTWLPWIPWQPNDFREILLESPSSSKLPSLLMVNEFTNPQKLDKENFPKVNEIHNASEKSDNGIKIVEAMQPIPEVNRELPKEPLSGMKENHQEEVVLFPPPQTLKEEPIHLKLQPSVSQSKIPLEEHQVKEPVSVKTFSPLHPSQSKTTCFKMGSYASMTEAHQVMHWLKQQKVMTVEVQNRETQVITGTWVYLPPFKNQEATLKAAHQLNRLGVHDYQIITSGEFNHAISLGVYRQQENVNNLLRKLKNGGYSNPQTEKRYKNETTYQLNVKILSDETTSTLLKVIEKKFNLSPLMLGHCQG